MSSPQLTTRMKEVLELVAHGLANSQIATRLQISPKTVEIHKGRLFKAYKVHNSVSLILAANKNGDITL